MSACRASRTDGRVCLAPARFLDAVAGGLVCVEHRPHGVCWHCGVRLTAWGVLCTPCRAEAREEAQGDKAQAEAAP